MLAPCPASLFRYRARGLPITFVRCLFSKITTTMWSGCFAASFDFLGTDCLTVLELFGATGTMVSEIFGGSESTLVEPSGAAGRTVLEPSGATGSAVHELSGLPAATVGGRSVTVQAPSST